MAEPDIIAPAPATLLDASVPSFGGTDPLAWHDLNKRAGPLVSGAIHIGIDQDGRQPGVDPAHYDILLTTAAVATRPWVSVPAGRLDEMRRGLARSVRDNPVAAVTLARLLRITENLPFETALEMESLAYSSLLGSGEFQCWLERRGPRSTLLPQSSQPVTYHRSGPSVTLSLNVPQTRNAMTAAMRDALFEALVNVIEDPSCPAVTLQGEGRCFSTGGALDEFGTTPDLMLAHLIRTRRSAALLLDRLGRRAAARLHGACIGAGIEIPAAAAQVSARPDFWAQLPEVGMGLIPGAGGTVTIPRRIGRHRACWMMLGGKRIGIERALEWNLVDSRC